MQDSVLTVQHLSVTFLDRQFGRLEAVKDVSFTLKQGRTLAIVGESGSGKSVSSLAVMGLLPPTAEIKAEALRLGELDLTSLDTQERRALRGRRMAMIFQEPMTSLNPLVPVGQQITEALRLHLPLSKKLAEEKMLHLVDQVGLPTPRLVARRYPHELSGGQQQRIMIAMAISCEPELLIADEPTTALDVTIQRQVIDLIMKLQETYRMSLLFITHDLALVADIADDVAVMYRGEMLEKRPALELFKRPEHAYTRGLLACRPPLDKRPHRLLTVSDFMKQNAPQERELVSLSMEVNVVQPPQSSPPPPISSSPTILELRNLCKFYPQKASLFAAPTLFKAVDHVNLQVRRGMRLGIVGESGCGKTTLARCMIRLLDPTAGKILFDGEDISQARSSELVHIRRRLQYIFQNPYAALNPRLPIADILTEPLVIHGLGGNQEDRLARAALTLEKVGLRPEMLHRYPHEFSGGQRQRICIARVLMLDPELIICDECVSALDVSVQAQILNLLLDIQERTGITFIFISHDLSVVKYFAEEVCVMSQGQIVEQGPADEIYARPQHAFTRRLLEAIPRGIPKGSLQPIPSFY